jgi:hypothetical protein
MQVYCTVYSMSSVCACYRTALKLGFSQSSCGCRSVNKYLQLMMYSQDRRARVCCAVATSLGGDDNLSFGMH